MSASTIADGKVVQFHYTLKNDAGDVLDSSAGSEPMGYLHGAQNIVPGLESQMTGKSIGDKFDASVAPAEGYGEKHDDAFHKAPKEAFPEDMELAVGMQLIMQGDDGRRMPVWVAEVAPDYVVLDANHPLAGETLHFAIEIVGMRDATQEEGAHGHPHGPGGHHH